MAEIEALVSELVERGWTLKRVVYDDEADEDFHVTLTMTVNGQDEQGGVL